MPRVIIEGVAPEIDGGRFAIKRVVGEAIVVEANVFTDGHDVLACALRYQQEGAGAWQDVPMEALGNDRWRAMFRVSDLGRWRYTLRAWVDEWLTWRRDLEKKVDAAQDVTVDLLVGAELIEAAARRAGGGDGAALRRTAAALRRKGDTASRVAQGLDATVLAAMTRHPDLRRAVTYEKELVVVVDRMKAGWSAWYEMFPRSTSPVAGRHGTFRDCETRLPYVAGMGFDVLYLPPIHPIGRTHRKGKNNSARCGPDDPGSPWAIGSREGGHTAVHPQLGTLEDFRRLVKKAKELGLEVALDIAFQCSPDHPWVNEHPEWFRWRPDGTLQYAENPPKRYEDIYPLNFDTPDWRALWAALKDVLLFWIEQGVRIFRVDNPHTKPFAFWEATITDLKRRHPDLIFLSEAFTRPNIMYELAKLGFTQSYTYFAWRNTKWELTQYLTELTQPPVKEFFRPSFWPNTPDILTEYLQWGGRPAFAARLVLAATLGANYGIYGPAFELGENRPLAPGREEYLEAEKYELKRWDLERPDSLRELITLVNQARRSTPALQQPGGLQFHHVDNEQLLCYSKATEDRASVVLVVVNLDYRHTQSGWIHLSLEALALDATQPFQAHDLLSGARYLWHGPRNFVELNPHAVPAHLFQIRRRVLREQDFDYFL